MSFADSFWFWIGKELAQIAFGLFVAVVFAVILIAVEMRKAKR